MLKKIVIGLVVIVVVVAACAYFYLNSQDSFAKVTVTETKMGPMTFVYIPYKGDYMKIGAPIMSFNDKITKEYNITSSKGFGIYYSDPSATKPEDRKADIGLLLEGKDAQKMKTIMKKYHAKWIGPKNYVVATFPIKSMASYGIGAMKVYPVLGAYMKANHYKMTPSFELYDMTAKQITYGFEIKK